MNDFIAITVLILINIITLTSIVYTALLHLEEKISKKKHRFIVINIALAYMLITILVKLVILELG